MMRRDWHDHFIDHDRRHHDGLARAERRRQDELLYDAALDSGDSDMGWDGIVPAIQAGRYAIPKGEKLDITVASAAGPPSPAEPRAPVPESVQMTFGLVAQTEKGTGETLGVTVRDGVAVVEGDGEAVCVCGAPRRAQRARRRSARRGGMARGAVAVAR